MVQGHLTSRALSRCKGVLPCGRSDAARRDYALVSGPRGRFAWDFVRLANSQTRATQGRVRPRGDASNDCSSRFMVQEHLTRRVLRRCKGARGSETRASCQPSILRTRGPRPTSGGRQRRLFLMVYGAKTSDVPRLETVQGRPPKGARGTVAPPKGPRKPPKRRWTRPGAPMGAGGARATL